MSGYLPVPEEVTDEVDQYVHRELRSVQRYDGRSLLDESGIDGLHQLVGRIYAKGFHDGASHGAYRATAVRLRKELLEADDDRA